MLKEVFGLFGEGIHESLLRTQGNYLEATNGAKAKSKLTDWEKRDAKNLLSHNNFAERPFAIVKELMKRFPSLKLSHASAIASAKANGTFDELGAANISDPLLQKVVNKLCGIRKATPGTITTLLRGFLCTDQAAQKAHRILHRKNQEKVNADLAKGRVVKSNAAQETVLHRTPEALQSSLDSFGELRGHVGKKLAYLKQQFTGRMGRGYEYEDKQTIPMNYRSPSKPYKLVMKKDDRPQVPYLKELLLLMVAVDKKEGRKDVPLLKKKVIRSVPTIAPAYTNKVATALKTEQLEEATKAAAPKDDETLVELADRFVGKIWWDCDTEPYRTWKVVDITTSGPVNKAVQYINATCVEVVRGQCPNDFEIPARVVVGSGDDAIYDPDMQEDLVLVDLTKDPDSTVVQPYLDEYIEAHRQREDALGMAAEDFNCTGTGTATPATKTKGKKRKQMSKSKK